MTAPQSLRSCPQWAPTGLGRPGAGHFAADPKDQTCMFMISL